MVLFSWISINIICYYLVRFQYFIVHVDDRKNEGEKERKWQWCVWSLVELGDARRRLCKRSLKQKVEMFEWTSHGWVCLLFFLFNIVHPGELDLMADITAITMLPLNPRMVWSRKRIIRSRFLSLEEALI